MASFTILDSESTLEPLLDGSESRRAIIFKHSLTCPVSTAGLQEYQKFLDQHPDSDDVIFTLIEIQKQRGLSNRVAEVSGVRHESPQAIVVEGGKVLWHASHWNITESNLKHAMAS